MVSNLEGFISHFDWRFQIDTAPATTTRTLGVAFDKHSLDEECLPGNIKIRWRHDLMVIVLQDLENNQFGACRHTLHDGYDIIYRLDIEENVLKSVARAPRWTFDLDNNNTPTLSEILRDAKVWISFHESQANQPLSDSAVTPVASTATATETVAKASPVEEIDTSPNSLAVGSPALSDTTLIGDGTSPLLKEAAIKIEPPASTQKQESNPRQRRARFHPVLEPYVDHPRFTKAVQKALHYESTRKGMPPSAWPQYLRRVHGLYLCDGPSAFKQNEAASRPDLLQLLKCRSSDQPLPNYDQHALEFAKFGLVPRIEDWGTMGQMAQSRTSRVY